ncbi:hypothetical protein SAMN04487964_108113 [Marinobacterium sediminicola]|uniref:Uncharacterized protein n=1 Tax=Marinobacterium sediminicola TaxID=518898 RepID=A0ABY1S0V3_9GAMM|nr:hypothetical protein SAMN04487964_108113 [Marinobacterium sediminicola]
MIGLGGVSEANLRLLLMNNIGLLVRSEQTRYQYGSTDGVAWSLWLGFLVAVCMQNIVRYQHEWAG